MLPFATLLSLMSLGMANKYIHKSTRGFPSVVTWKFARFPSGFPAPPINHHPPPTAHRFNRCTHLLCVFCCCCKIYNGTKKLWNSLKHETNSNTPGLIANSSLSRKQMVGQGVLREWGDQQEWEVLRLGLLPERFAGESKKLFSVNFHRKMCASTEIKCPS